jgi:hypothetical protein
MGELPANVVQDDNTLEIFAFPAASAVPCQFSFSVPSASSLPRWDTHPKRLRPLADVDGDGSNGVQKKKRRLRLVLITSRLSQPFSAPPTHIVSRGSSKIAVWAKQKALGRSLLRKAAIMNRIRRRSLSTNEIELRRLGTPLQTMMYDYSAMVILYEGLAEKEGRNHPFVNTSPRRQYLPLPPSPLGLSNYDVFDNEDGFFDDDGEEGEGLIYSDFNILEPCEPVVDDHDFLSPVDNDPAWGKLVPLAEERMVEIMKEKERQKEISFVRFEI